MPPLDLKYRPKTFQDVLGNDGVKQLLIARVQNGTLGDQSMMLGGPKGCGKTTLARLIARALLCSSTTNGEPCGECSACVSILNETHADVEELDAASQGTVDKVRSMIRDVDYEINSSYRIYILDEAQRLSASAQDALLKAVENRSFIVILCTTEPHKIREPIRSRVEEYPVSAPSTDQILERMLYVAKCEEMTVEENALHIIANIHKNCPRSCLLTLNLLASTGSVTEEAAKQHFRFDSYQNVVGLLSLLSQDLSRALVLLESVTRKETATWIRDTIVFAISSAVRHNLKVGHKFPTEVDDIVPNSQSLIQLAHKLGLIEKPLHTDIEVALLDYVVPHDPPAMALPVSSQPVRVSPPEPIQRALEPVMSPVLTPDLKPVRPEVAILTPQPLEIDGVRFSAEESLTSLDEKISSTSGKDDTTNDTVSVKFDENSVPITEKQFIDGFLSNIKK